MHRCVHCGRILEKANRELLDGCANCGSKFFFFIRDENLIKTTEFSNIDNLDKEAIEKDVREILGVEDEEKPVVLDLEAI
ncbi:MAG: Zn-ribbon containing protein, partial [Candidatus Pacearchaeota archaeon]